MEINRRSFEEYINHLSTRAGTAGRIYNNITRLKNLSDEQLRLKILNGKLGQLVEKNYRDSPPCSHMAREIYHSYNSLREKGECPAIPFLDRMEEIMVFAQRRIDTSIEKCRDNSERESELYEKYQNDGELSEYEMGKLVRFEEDQRNYNRMMNSYILVGNKILGKERIGTLRALNESKEHPIVKLYERRLAERGYRYFMETPVEQIIDDILSECDAQNLSNTKNNFSPRFGLFEWTKIPSLTPYQTVMKEMAKWKKSASK